MARKLKKIYKLTRKKMNYLKVSRKLPINLKKYDKKLFLHELDIKIKKPLIIKRRNIYILNSTLKKFKYYKFH